MNGVNGYRRGQMSLGDYDDYNEYSRPTSTASNIIALYARDTDSSGSGEESTPIIPEYAERRTPIPRPLPQPPPPPPSQIRTDVPQRTRSPLPPTPSTALSTSTQMQARRGMTPPHAIVEHREVPRRMPYNVTEGDSNYYDRQGKPLQYTPSTASSSTSASSDRQGGYYKNRPHRIEPKTPPPWSPGSSVSFSSPSEPSSSQHPSTVRQYQDYSGAGYSRSGAVMGEEKRSMSGSRQKGMVESMATSMAQYHEVAQDPSMRNGYGQIGPHRVQGVGSGRVSESDRRQASDYRIVSPPAFPSEDSSSRLPRHGQTASQPHLHHLPPPPLPSPRGASGVSTAPRDRSMSLSPQSATARQYTQPQRIHFQENSYGAYDPASFYNQGLLSPVMLSAASTSQQGSQSSQEEQGELDYSLLSNIALLLRDSVPRGLHIKGSVNYPFCFTGKDVVSTIQSLLPKEVFAWAAGIVDGEVDVAEGRRIALLIAKTLKSQLFFHEVDWSTGDLQDGVEDVYMFLEDSLAGSAGKTNNGRLQSNTLDRESSVRSNGTRSGTKRATDGLDELPTGVFTAMTGCYSPLCSKPGAGRESSCYSSSCPYARSETYQRSPLTSLTAPSLIDSSKAGITSGSSQNAIAWADTVPKDFLANVPKKEIKRQNAILEMIQKEEEFLHDLELLDTLFLARLDKPDPTTGDPPPIPIGPDRDDFIREVFSNHRELVDVIRGLVEKLHVRQREDHPFVGSVGDILLDTALGWEGAFETNMTNFPLAKNRITREATINPRFKVFLEVCRRDPACHRLPMENFLQRATTRLPRYNLHMKSILQDTEETSSDRDSLERAIEVIDKQCRSIQKGVAAAQSKVQIREYAYSLETKRNRATVQMDLLNPERQLLLQGSVLRKPEFAGMEWQELLAILFDNYMVVVKAKRREDGDDSSSRLVLAKRPIAVEMMQLIGFNDASVSRSMGLSNFHIRSNADRDFRDLYPFTIAHIGGRMEPLTLYVSSKAVRDEWKIKLEEAKSLRAAVQEANKVFESHIISADSFAIPSVTSLDPEKPPTGVDPSDFHGVVACAVPFQTMDGRRLIAIGCADGVWIGLRNDSRSLRKVLHLKLVTQCAVLQSFNIFVVLADKVLIAYSLEALVPTTSSGNNPKPPQKLSGNRDVLFFSVGQLRDRTLLLYMKKKANESVFRALEPVISDARSQTKSSNGGGGGLFGKFGKDTKVSDSFRLYKTFFIPSEAYSMQFLRSKLCIVCARGFEIINLDSLLPGTIPDFSQAPRDDPRIQLLMKRVETAKPLGMFKNSESEFLLCYDGFACYVDRLGEPIRLDNIIEWEGLPRSVAFRSPYILAFDPRFIEVRDSSTGQLVQLIATNELRNISGSSTTVASMDDEDEDAILLVQRVRNDAKKMEGPRTISYDYQQVFQLVSTAYYRQAHPITDSQTGSSSMQSSLGRMGTSSTSRTYTSSSASPKRRAWI